MASGYSQKQEVRSKERGEGVSGINRPIDIENKQNAENDTTNTENKQEQAETSRVKQTKSRNM